MNAILNFILGLVPRRLLNSDSPNSDPWRRTYSIPIMRTSKSPVSTTKEQNTPISPVSPSSARPSSTTPPSKCSSASPSSASPPSYNDVSGAVIIGQDGNPQFLSPEEEVERHHRLQQAVREKMLGLPRTTIFEWHQGTSETSTGTDELQLPPYTPEDEKK